MPCRYVTWHTRAYWRVATTPSLQPYFTTLLGRSAPTDFWRWMATAHEAEVAAWAAWVEAP